MSRPGYYKGKHYTLYVEKVKQLKREEKFSEVIDLLKNLIEATEQESKYDGGGVAPWYYEQLAIVYHKQKYLEMEIEILKRYANQKHAPGAMPEKLIQRLEKLCN